MRAKACLHFTQAEFKRASEVSALAYAQQNGYDLIPRGQHEYRLREHDSMVFRKDGWWYWNSQNLRGKALQFAIKYEGLNPVEAVLKLCCYLPADFQFHISSRTEQRPFCLPPRETDAATARRYLIDTRGLDPEIVAEQMDQGHIYLTRSSDRQGHTHANVVFVGYDAKGIPRSATLRGISDAYKGCQDGADKTVPFSLASQSASRLAIFESPIDALSHASLERWLGLDWRVTARIATSGNAAPGTVVKYIGQHPSVRTVLLCQDNDNGGHKQDEKIRKELDHYPELTIVSSPPPKGKDYNDYLRLAKLQHVPV